MLRPRHDLNFHPSYQQCDFCVVYTGMPKLQALSDSLVLIARAGLVVYTLPLRSLSTHLTDNNCYHLLCLPLWRSTLPTLGFLVLAFPSFGGNIHNELKGNLACFRLSHKCEFSVMLNLVECVSRWCLRVPGTVITFMFPRPGIGRNFF